MQDLKAGGYLIAQIHQLSQRIFAKKLKQHQIVDINPAQGRILFALWKKDGLPIIELAKATSLSKSTLTPMLDRLEEIGHLKRVDSEEDRRKKLIYLTEKNKKLQDIYYQVSLEMKGLYYKGFSEKEIDQFEDHLKRILSNLKEK
ncbi:MAG: MarR family winged helix-turn-helix transcriptional regulator [Candidatus Thorarchaeota archaeon]